MYPESGAIMSEEFVTAMGNRLPGHQKKPVEAWPETSLLGTILAHAKRASQRENQLHRAHADLLFPPD